MNNDLEMYGELSNAYQSVENEGGHECFIFFLRYCANRLEQGASVQEIWNVWKERKA